MSAETIFDNSTGKFTDVNLHFVESGFFITGYHFTRNNTLKGNVEFFKHHTSKRINVSLHKMNGCGLMDITNVKTYSTIQKCKYISIIEFETFIQIKFYI